MKKFLLSLICVLTAVCIHADLYDSGTLSKEWTSTPATATLNNVDWKLTVNWTTGSFYGNDTSGNNKGFQLGSGSAQYSTATFTTDGIEGDITAVTVNGSIASKGNCKVSVKVGDTDFTCNSATSATLTTTATDYTFTGSASGPITITYTSGAKKATYLKQIQVTYETSTLLPANLQFATNEARVVIGQAYTAPELTKDTDAPVAYVSTNPEVATVNPTTGAVTIEGPGTTTIKATTDQTDVYKAGSAEYQLTVIDPAVPVEIYFSELGADFTFDNPANVTVWQHDTQYGLKGSAFTSGAAHAAEAIAASPVIDLSQYGEATLNFQNAFNNYKINNAMIDIAAFAGYAYLVVKAEDETEWRVLGEPTVPTSFSWTFFDNNAVDLSDYAGENIQIGFKYVSTEECAGTWEVKNVSITGKIATGTIKPRPELTFSKDVVTVEEGTEEFEAPVLTYPEGLTITYSTSDDNVALVDEKTGYVIIGKAGDATITATSAETDEYRSGTASYTIHVTEKPKTPSQLAWSATEWSVMEGTTDMTGAPELNNPLGIDVAYASSDEEVAMIDENGAIVLMGKVGSTVIAAAPADADTYSGTVSYTLTVTAKPVLGAITLNGTAVEDGLTYTFTEGTELVFAVENAEMLQIEAVTEDNTTAFEFLDEAATATWTNAAIGSYVVSVETTGFGQKDSAIFTIEVTEKPEVIEVTGLWQRVTSLDKINEVTPYMIAGYKESTTSWYAPTGEINGKNLASNKLTVHNDLLVSEESHAGEVYITKAGEYYHLYMANAKISVSTVGGYLTCNGKGSNNYVTAQSTIAENGASDLTMTMAEDGAITAKFMASSEDTSTSMTDRVNFRFNDSSTLFSCYKSGQNDIYLYEPVTEAIDAVLMDGESEISADESINLKFNEPRTITMKLAPKHDGYWMFVEETTEPAAVKAYAEHTPAEGFSKFVPEEGITLTEAGTLHHYTVLNGKVSETQTLTVTGSTTAIFEIEAAESAASEWFDLQGRRVAAPAKGGVYILKQGSKVSKRAI